MTATMKATTGPKMVRRRSKIWPRIATDLRFFTQTEPTTTTATTAKTTAPTSSLPARRATPTPAATAAKTPDRRVRRDLPATTRLPPRLRRLLPAAPAALPRRVAARSTAGRRLFLAKAEMRYVIVRIVEKEGEKVLMKSSRAPAGSFTRIRPLLLRWIRACTGRSLAVAGSSSSLARLPANPSKRRAGTNARPALRPDRSTFRSAPSTSSAHPTRVSVSPSPCFLAHRRR